MSTLTLPRKFHVKRNDEVEVISGVHKGQSGKVLQVLRKKGRVIVEGVNVRKKAIRPTQDNPQGGFEEKETSLHISNVKLVKAPEKAPKKKAAAKKKSK
ncbi:MAG: 50S ribosomal protein L24 [Verrucomicrobiota bacterium]